MAENETGRYPEEDEYKYDSNGEPYVVVEGKRVAAPKMLKSSGFTHFDTAGGRCGLCGSLTCSGSCFK